jgi:Tol biopolymer transport system component
VRRDGTHVNRLAGDLQPLFPSWSPSGNTIAFQSSETGRSYASDVWVVNSDGTGERELALNADVWGWSADGTGVIYSTPSCGGSFVLSLPGPCAPSLYVYWLNRDHAEILVSSTTMTQLTPDYARFGFGGTNWGRLP